MDSLFDIFVLRLHVDPSMKITSLDAIKCVYSLCANRAATMSSDTHHPIPSSPVKDSAHFVRVHSSPSPVISGATGIGSAS